MKSGLNCLPGSLETASQDACGWLLDVFHFFQDRCKVLDLLEFQRNVLLALRLQNFFDSFLLVAFQPIGKIFIWYL